MAMNLPPQGDLPRPKIEDMDVDSAWHARYDKKRDTFFVHAGRPRPATSVELFDGLWLRMDPRTGEVYGFEIEDFRQVFLVRHPEFAPAWKQWNSRSTPASQKLNWWQLLVAFIKRMCGDGGPGGHPQQPRLGSFHTV